VGGAAVAAHFRERHGRGQRSLWRGLVRALADPHDPAEDLGRREALAGVWPLAAQCLSRRQRVVVEMRFGFTGPRATLGQVARVLGVCRDRVRQLEARALRSLECNDALRAYVNANDLLGPAGV
jgi:DNA-directed RNA polymerase sigma subunit (sigma70/sigma32)